jgi:hypothetical protein
VRNRGLGHLWDQDRDPITPPQARAQHQVRRLIGQPADFGKRVLDTLAGRRFMDQCDSGRLIGPFIADVYADVIPFGNLPRERSGQLQKIPLIWLRTKNSLRR